MTTPRLASRAAKQLLPEGTACIGLLGLARRFGVSPIAINSWLLRGWLPAPVVQQGARLLWLDSDIRAWEQSGCPCPRPDAPALEIRIVAARPPIGPLPKLIGTIPIEKVTSCHINPVSFLTLSST